MHEIGIPDVVFVRVMKIAVNFDRKAGFITVEIENIRPNGLLPFKDQTIFARFESASVT